MDALLLDEILDLLLVLALYFQFLEEGLLFPEEEILLFFGVLVFTQWFFRRKGLLQFASSFLSLG